MSVNASHTHPRFSSKSYRWPAPDRRRSGRLEALPPQRAAGPRGSREHRCAWWSSWRRRAKCDGGVEGVVARLDGLSCGGPSRMSWRCRGLLYTWRHGMDSAFDSSGCPLISGGRDGSRPSPPYPPHPVAVKQCPKAPPEKLLPTKAVVTRAASLWLASCRPPDVAV